MTSLAPHGGDALGATPGHPLLTPALSGARDLSMSCQQAMLDLAAIQRIPGLVGYWPADPAYLCEDSAGTIPASVGGVVGCVRNVLAAPVYTPVTVANQGFDADTDWTKGTGWTIAAGVATKAAGTASVLAQAVSLVAGATYVLTWTMTRSAGTLTPRFTGGTTNTGTGMVLSGTYEEDFVATTGNATLEFSADASFAGTVDNVTLVAVSNSPALQATTAVKPYLRKTPRSGVYWLDSNTTLSTLTATLGNLGTACTVARSGAEGVTFTEGVTISSTYNIATAFGFNGDIAIFNRDLTTTEKALLTRYMQRGVPVLGSNLVTNGTFDSADGWTPGTGITIADGKASYSAVAHGTNLYRSVPVTLSTQYLFGVEGLTQSPTGALTVYLAGESGLATNVAVQIPMTPGRKVRAAVCVRDGQKMNLQAATVATFQLDNVTLQAIL